MKDKPVVQSITVGEESNSKWLDNLSDLVNIPKVSVKSTADMDPTLGVFIFSSEQPPDFEKIGQIRIRTRGYIAENQVLAAESQNKFCKSDKTILKLVNFSPTSEIFLLKHEKLTTLVFVFSANWQRSNSTEKV